MLSSSISFAVLLHPEIVLIVVNSGVKLQLFSKLVPRFELPVTLISSDVKSMFVTDGTAESE